MMSSIKDTEKVIQYIQIIRRLWEKDTNVHDGRNNVIVAIHGKLWYQHANN